MSDFIMVSPLLDGYTLEKTVMNQRDRTWYSVRHTASGECFVLKHLSVPASDAQVRALILSGIYENEHDVLAYYTGLVSDIKRELELGKKLAETGCFAGPVDYQIVQKTDGIGYDIYILQALQLPLNELISRNGMTHLRAVNLGIDLCDAIIACRDAGYLFANLKPDNIFLVPSGKFMLGDLGLVPLQDLEYASISEDYIGPFSPPELFDITGIPNLTLDLYSLGMVLYRIYNGNHGPFEDENTDLSMADKLRLSGKALPTPIYADYELAGIITKACSFRVESRFSSPEQLKEALLLYLQRNQIPDSLIVPPLVVDPEPVAEEPVAPAEEEAEPLRMVDATELDASFKENFAPSTENVGTDILDLPLEEAKSEEVAPDEPAPVEPVPAEPTPVEATSPETAPAEATPAEATPAETASAETAPAEAAPVGTAEASADATAPTEGKRSRSRKKAPLVISIDETHKAESTETTEEIAVPVADATPDAPAEQEAPATEEPAKESPVAEEAPSGKEAPAPVEETQKEADASTADKDALLSANTVSGPKMPTGNLRMQKKGKNSRKHRNLVLEIPQESEKTVSAPEEPKGPVTVQVDTPTEEATVKVGSAPEKSGDFTFAPGSTPAPSEENDIDRLIASVNEVVGSADDDPDIGAEDSTLTMHVAPADSGYYDPYGESADSDRTDGSGEKKKSKWLPITLIALLAAALIGVIVFLMDNYYVNITSLELLSHSTESLTVELITPDAQDCFIVTCTDNYGNSYPRSTDGNTYTFSGLRENTAYTVTVISSEYHRLRSGRSYTMTVKTPGTTKIENFNARRGTQPGDVVLNFTSEGPSPEAWQYTYTDDKGVLSGPFPFNDHTALITGLEEGTTYTFAIEAPKDLFLSGETTVEYTLLPIVTVTSLHISDVDGSTVTIAWSCEENFPAEWTVTCEGGDYSSTQVTSNMKVSFADLPALDRDYTFYVSALGMDEPATTILPANPVIVEDLKAEYQEDGSVQVTWNTPAGYPTDGWYLSYNTLGSLHVPYVVTSITTNSVTLTGLIPNAEYELRLHLTGEESTMSMYGETIATLVTPEAEAFSGYDIDPAPVYDQNAGNLSLWLCPEKEDWTYNDLEKTRNEFAKDERIAVCLQVEGISASDDTVKLMYVIRNESGQVVTDETREFTWNDLWFERRHANEVPLPKAVGEGTSLPGKYTLEVYINGQLLLQRNFTIV